MDTYLTLLSAFMETYRAELIATILLAVAVSLLLRRFSHTVRKRKQDNQKSRQDNLRSLGS